MPNELAAFSPMHHQSQLHGSASDRPLSFLYNDCEKAVYVNDQMPNKGQDDKEKSAKAPLDVILIEKCLSCFDVGINVKSLKQNACHKEL